jgi:PKD repeat protein
VGVTTTVETTLHQAVFSDVYTFGLEPPAHASGVYADRTFTWDTSWAANGTYAIRATGAGGVSTVQHAPKAPTRIVVNNVPPTVEAGPDRSVTAGNEVAFSGAFTDPGLSDAHAIWWDFGDGFTSSGVLTPTHSYVAEGVYTATLTVADGDGGVGSAAVQVVVSPAEFKIYLPVVMMVH